MDLRRQSWIFLFIMGCGAADSASNPGDGPGRGKAVNRPDNAGDVGDEDDGAGEGGEDGDSPGQPGRPNPSSNADAGGGSGGSGGSDASTGTGDSGTPPPPPPPTSGGAPVLGLTLDEVAVYQGVKIPVARGGAAVGSRNGPIVANRPALVRAFVSRDGAYRNQTVRGELRLRRGGNAVAPIVVSKAVAANSTDDRLDSTFNFDVPEGVLDSTTEFSVALIDPGASGAGNPRAIYPSSGASESLGVRSSGDRGIRVMLVPYAYGADGSNRLPDTSPAQIERYRTAFFALFPAAKIEIAVHDPVPWSRAIASNGNGFSDVLQATVQLRQRERPDANVFYYGIFAPAASSQAYCSRGCVAGLSGLGTNPRDAAVRASVGIGFTGAQSAQTSVHEVGHALGLPHAPCGTQDAERNFPYANASIGVWGYDLLQKRLINPNVGKDFMSYCQNEWISDYNYRKIFDRIALINNAAFVLGGWNEARTYRFVSVDPDGSVRWGERLPLEEPPTGARVEVARIDRAGRVVRRDEGAAYPFDHLGGGFLLVPDDDAADWEAVRIDAAGIDALRRGVTLKRD
jgi:hypothetical protein